MSSSAESAEQTGQPGRGNRHLIPFVAASVLAWIAVPIGSSMHWGTYALAAVLAMLAGTLRAVPLRGALAKGREAIPSLIFLLAIALLRDSAGGVNSAVGVLALLPVFYTALYSNRAQLCTVLIGMATVFLAQNLLVGPPTYPHTEYRAGLIFIVVSTIIGLTTQWLVTQARFQTAEAQDRERMLEQIAEVVRNLSNSPHARAEVCAAAKTISNASMAILYEPTGASGELCSTSMAGIEIDRSRSALTSAPACARHSAPGARCSLTRTASRSSSTARSGSSPATRHRSCASHCSEVTEPIGVLVVGWPQGGQSRRLTDDHDRAAGARGRRRDRTRRHAHPAG